MSHAKGSVCACQPVSYPAGNTLQKLLTHGPETYNPHYAPLRSSSHSTASQGQSTLSSFQNSSSSSSSSSSSPPELSSLHSIFRKKMAGFHPYSPKIHKPVSTTLQNVLMGEIPSEYSHLTSGQFETHKKSASPSYAVGRSSPVAMQHHQHQQHSLRIPSYNHHDLSNISRSPLTSSPSSSSLSSSSARAIPSPLGRSPRQLTPSPRSFGSPAHPMSVSPSNHVMMTPPPHVPSPLSNRGSPLSTASECQDEPMDLSRKGSTHSESEKDGYCSETEFPRSGESPLPASSSMLRNLLSIGKHLHKSADRNDNQFSDSDESNPPETVVSSISSTTRVTLAKKNMFPVSSRVSDWLVKIVQFAKAIPEFQSLSHNDKITLILNSWTRLLILLMAESNFQFAVTPIHKPHNAPSSSSSSSSSSSPSPGSTPSQEEMTSQSGPAPDEPTMKSVEGIQNFIRKCQTMNLDQKEYVFLRMAVLFNGGYVGLDKPDHIDQLNSLIQQLLQEHVTASRPNDVMHYSRLLLCLPSLYGMNCKMIENLFCGHINGNMDLQVLLKEMLNLQ